ncbi:hypothetical protein E5D57_009138 [Metarhizium anisopliae]|nr:hypothetical protein E5D57_009138 [Metarhizium anisopliae]
MQFLTPRSTRLTRLYTCPHANSADRATGIIGRCTGIGIHRTVLDNFSHGAGACVRPPIRLTSSFEAHGNLGSMGQKQREMATDGIALIGQTKPAEPPTSERWLVKLRKC